MKQFRYTLERYKGMKTRHDCPACGKRKTYTRYVDQERDEYLPYEYGKCERLNNCGYHLNPYQSGYAKQIWLQERDDEKWREVKLEEKPLVAVPKKPPSKPVYIPFDLFRRSLNHYDQNAFAKYLTSLFGEAKTIELIQRFYIGTSGHWKHAGACIFWLIDERMNIGGGQVILFDEKGRTKKEHRPDGSKKRYNSWVHTALKASYRSQGKSLPSWLKAYIEMEGNKFPCLFGLPQLKTEPLHKPIAIVEAAKTAIIATGYLPQYIWLAVGSLSYLNEARVKVLQGRNITLFPDRGAYEPWRKKADTFSAFAKITVSDLLERKKAEEGSDLADYLVRFEVSGFQDL